MSYPSTRDATVCYNAVRVDPEIRPDRVLRKVALAENEIKFVPIRVKGDVSKFLFHKEIVFVS